MSLATRAADRAIGRLERAAAIDLPGDIAVERTSGGLRLTGRGLRHRWLTDISLRGLSVAARVLR